MPLQTLPHNSLEPLLRKHLSKREDPNTTATIKTLAAVRDREYLTKQELELVCRWKSPRAIRYIRHNQEKDVRTLTRKTLATRSERKKLELLTGLSGVSPMASAILMLTNPKRYGVIDICVWQLLHKIGTVNTTPSGAEFGFNQWYPFLTIIRYFARKLDATARDVERTLFNVHRRYQRGKVINTWL